MAHMATNTFRNMIFDSVKNIQNSFPLPSPSPALPVSVGNLLTKMASGWTGTIELTLSFPGPNKMTQGMDVMREEVKALGANYDPNSYIWTLKIAPVNFEPYMYELVEALAYRGVVLGASQAFGTSPLSKCQLNAFAATSKARFVCTYHEREDIQTALPVRWDAAAKNWYLGIEYLKSATSKQRDQIEERGWFRGIDPAGGGFPVNCVPWVMLPTPPRKSVHVLLHSEARRAIAISEHPTSGFVSFTHFVTTTSNQSYNNYGAPEQMETTQARLGWERLVSSGYAIAPYADNFIDHHLTSLNRLCATSGAATTNYALNA